MPIHNPARHIIEDEGTPLTQRTNVNFTGAGVSVADSGGKTVVTINGGGVGGDPVFTAFTKDLGTAKRSGTFDITGLSGLTANKVVNIIQTNAEISSKGNARDESEMDHISVTGYVVDSTTIRAYYSAPSVVVGEYAFAYLVSA